VTPSRRLVRVVSLVPSLTETLLAWGVTPVAVTRFCERPGLPTVGGTKDPDVAAIVALAPDVVVVNEEENRREDADALRAAGMVLHVTQVRAVADVQPMLDDLATAVGAARPVNAVVAPAAVATRTGFVPIWRRPWMTLNGDTYGASLLATVGIDTVYGDHPDRYPVVELDDAARLRPDLVVAPSEPYPFRARHRPELATVAADVRFVDGRDLFWWGARTAEAVERLAQALAP
jgi:ABC-type Fe3+-hydroxamate transport system substrate-binding protein